MGRGNKYKKLDSCNQIISENDDGGDKDDNGLIKKVCTQKHEFYRFMICVCPKWIILLLDPELRCPRFIAKIFFVGKYPEATQNISNRSQN